MPTSLSLIDPPQRVPNPPYRCGMIHQDFFDEHGQLEPGVTRRIPHNSSMPTFEIVATLMSLSPEIWHAKVTLFNETVLELHDSFASKWAAGNAAEQQLRARLVQLFRS